MVWVIIFLGIGGNRGLAALPFPLIPLVTSSNPQFHVSYLSGILVYGIVGLSAFGAFEFSKGNIESWREMGHSYLKQCLWPFVLAQRLVPTGQSGRRKLGVLILIFSLVLGLGIPSLLSMLVSYQYALEVSLGIGFTYLLIVREEAVTGAGRQGYAPDK